MVGKLILYDDHNIRIRRDTVDGQPPKFVIMDKHTGRFVTLDTEQMAGVTAFAYSMIAAVRHSQNAPAGLIIILDE